MKTYVCRKLFLYYYLCDRGFKPYKVCRDIHNADHYVWLYDSTPEIITTVEQYYKEMSQRIATEQANK